MKENEFTILTILYLLFGIMLTAGLSLITYSIYQQIYDGVIYTMVMCCVCMFLYTSCLAFYMDRLKKENLRF